MTRDIFFDKFDELAETPNGVARLRDLAVQLAVKGKLVAQMQEDEPASMLLESVRIQRAVMSAAGKIRLRPVGTLGVAERPFEIPSTWQWVRLADVGYELGQKVPDECFTYIDVGSIDSDKGRISERVATLNPGEAPSRARKIVAKGTVIYSTVRPYLLNIAVVDRDFDHEPIASTAFGILHPFAGVDNRYLFYWLRSTPFTQYVERAMKGMAYPAINDEKFYGGCIPLPPTAEQKRIVAKLEKLMALLDRLADQQEERSKQHFSLTRSSLARSAEAPTEANLTFLFNDSCAVPPPDLKTLVLDLAVRGKLVAQNPGDEPAEALLDKIQDQKKKLTASGALKADKKVWLGSSGTPPYEVPQTWSWAHLQDVFEVSRGGSPRPAGDPLFFGGPIPWITVGEVTKDSGKYLTSTSAGLTDEGAKRSRFIKPNDLLLTNSGATLGVPKISKIAGCINDGVAVLRQFHAFNLNDFAYLYLTQQTPAFRRVNQGMGQPNLNTPIIAGWHFPVPPLEEQRRIVEKTEYMLALVDRLGTQVERSRTTATSLMDALVDELALQD